MTTNGSVQLKIFAVSILQAGNGMFFVKISVTRLLYCEAEFVYTSWQSYCTFSQMFWHFMKKSCTVLTLIRWEYTNNSVNSPFLIFSPFSAISPAGSHLIQSDWILKLDWNMPFGFGEAPAGYNPKVHGPYDPAVYYGPSK